MAQIFRWMKVLAPSVSAILLAIPVTAPAQEIDPAKILKLSPRSGSLPLWSKPSADSRKDLGQVARSQERGVFLVGAPKVGFGTAWVISKKHRLLVTNAHVADIGHAAGGKLIAIASGTAQIYAVARTWYHPGVRRYLKGTGTLSVRSTDPREGDIDPQSPDLAVLQLAEDGPALTVEFTPATPGELAELFAQPAAIIGFPGHDTEGWPQLGDKAAATFHDGVVSRLTNFELSPSAPAAELQFVQYTMSTWGGFSGSPVFLASGRVAAVHNMARTRKGQNGLIKSIPHGVRVDCVLELLVHHGLDAKVPFRIDKTKVAVERWTKPDAKSEKARADYGKAAALVQKAERLYFKRSYQEAVDKCGEALKLVPNFAFAYSWRAAAIHSFWLNSDGVAKENRVRLLKVAYDDAIKSAQMQPAEPREIIQVCRVLQAFAWESGDDANYHKTLAVLGEMLTGENLTNYVRAEALSVRAFSNRKVGKMDAALADHNKALTLVRHEPNFFEARASYWENNDRDDLARADRARAKQLREGDVMVEWKGKWYPAIVRKRQGGKFYIQYVGYDESWNEWVTKERIKFSKK